MLSVWNLCDLKLNAIDGLERRLEVYGFELYQNTTDMARYVLGTATMTIDGTIWV